MDQNSTPAEQSGAETSGDRQDPRVAAALRRLAEVEGHAVDEHPGVYSDIDDSLRAALGSVDEEHA